MARHTHADGSVHETPDGELAEAIDHAARVLMHRELTKSPQVILTKADFDAFEQAMLETTNDFGIRLSVGEDEELIMTQVRRTNDA